MEKPNPSFNYYDEKKLVSHMNTQFTEVVDLSRHTSNLEIQTEKVVLQKDTKPKRGWNFGAFTFPLIWAFCNGCVWQGAIMFIPGVNQIWRFFLGGFGNRWAWNVYGDDIIGNFNKWEEVDKFNKIQKGWNIAGIIGLSVIAILVIVLW